MRISELLFGGSETRTPLGNIGLALYRVGAGLALAFQHGLGKIPPSGRFIEGVGNLGFPLPELFAWSAGGAEFLGGLFLALGFFTRPSSAFIAFTMGTAFFIRHADDPFRSKELAFLYLLTALAFLLIGCGRYGIDALIRRRNKS